MITKKNTLSILLFLVCGLGTAGILLFVLALETGNRKASALLEFLLHHAGFVIGALVLFGIGLVLPLMLKKIKISKTNIQ